MTTTDLARLRLVKAQVAAQEHECVECVEPIAKGERYMRAALPPTVEAFPDEEVFQEQAWQFVDRTWTIEKTHELCYAKRYFRPRALPRGTVQSLVHCGHRSFNQGEFCDEQSCPNWVGKAYGV